MNWEVSCFSDFTAIMFNFLIVPSSSQFIPFSFSQLVYFHRLAVLEKTGAFHFKVPMLEWRYAHYIYINIISVLREAMFNILEGILPLLNAFLLIINCLSALYHRLCLNKCKSALQQKKLGLRRDLLMIHSHTMTFLPLLCLRLSGIILHSYNAYKFTICIPLHRVKKPKLNCWSRILESTHLTKPYSSQLSQTLTIIYMLK